MYYLWYGLIPVVWQRRDGNYRLVCLSGTGTNGAGQVKILDTFPKKRLKLWKLISVYLSRTDKNSAGQVYVFNTFPKERLDYIVISTPAA